jgi:hypothetical protein
MKDDEDDNGGRWRNVLIKLLVDKDFCSSLEESKAIVESIEEEQEDNRDGDGEGDSPPGMDTENKAWNEALQDFLGISAEESKQIMDQCRDAISTSEGDGAKDDDDEDTNEHLKGESRLENNDDDDDDDDDDGQCLGPGECELCERDMKLTRHHLIPKSTWPRMEAKLQHEWHAWCQQEPDSTLEAPGWVQEIISQESLDSARNLSKSDQQLELDSKTIKIMFKHHTCQICRQCHSAIHKFYDNMTLAQQYNTTELLLQDQQVYKFCQWASKQRVGKNK